MGNLTSSTMASIFILALYYFLLANITAAETLNPMELGKTHSTGSVPVGSNYRRYLRSPLGSGIAAAAVGGPSRLLQISHSKIPIELDLLLDDDEIYDKSKRYDDYGHMRFGKRAGGEEQFDDYGHMRFGKRSDV